MRGSCLWRYLRVRLWLWRRTVSQAGCVSKGGVKVPRWRQAVRVVYRWCYGPGRTARAIGLVWAIGLVRLLLEGRTVQDGGVGLRWDREYG